MLFVLCAIAIAMVFAQTPASAADEEPVTVSGTLTLASAEQSTRTAGPNTFVTMHSAWVVAGDLVGTFDCNARAIMFSSGAAFVTEHGVYTVTWGDLEGTMNVRSVGTLGDDGLFHMCSTIVGGGTGDLAMLRGQGTVDLNINEGTASYSFEVFWEE